jgi:F-type H+-transporting ATPase subunit b
VAERGRLIAEAQRSAQIEKERLLAAAAEEISKLHREGEAAIVRERATAEQAIIGRAGELAIDIAARLLGRLPPGLGLAAFLDELNQELHALPREAKEGFVSATTDHPIEVVTAVSPAKGEMEDIRRALHEVLGSEPPIAFRSDPAVIAGIELHGRTTIVRNSWRADLDRILEDLDVNKQRGRS